MHTLIAEQKTGGPMIRLDDIKIRPKLLFFLLTTSIIPLLAMGLLFNAWTKRELITEAFDKLNTVQELRKDQVERNFKKLTSDIKLLAASARVFDVLQAMSRFEESSQASSFEALKTNTREYEKVIREFKTPLEKYRTLNEYRDLYIIDPDHGHVLYSSEQLEGAGTNLRHGQHRNSRLAKIWHDIIETGKLVITDFEAYGPANEQKMGFLGHPVFNQSDEIIGVVVVRFDAQLITEIIESTKGMGETGESYLIGWTDQDRFEFRSNLKTMGGGAYVVGESIGIDLDYWNDAKNQGEMGGHGLYIDSAGNDVLVSYSKLKMKELDWYLISKINRYEVTAPMRTIYREASFAALFLVLVIIATAWGLSKSFTEPIITEMKFADAISHGELGATLSLDRKDELGDLAESLNTMSLNLHEVDWLKSGKEALDDELRGEKGPNELAQRCISFYVKHLGAQLGAFFLNQRGILELRASYSFTDRKGNYNQFELGEGMVGQAALEGEAIFFSDIQDNAPPFNYGAGEDIPHHFVAAPLVTEGDITGVLLIGSTTPFTDQQKKFLQQTSQNIAILINAARSRKRISQLLDDAKKQHEEVKRTNQELEEQTNALRSSEAELQSQQEELRVTNEELEEQTRALKESESKLQAQQEELRVTNEELQERTLALEEQRKEIWAKNVDLQEAQEIVEKKMSELEIASRYKSEFLANMSHELRTPLNSILILSQLIANNREENLTPKQVESATAINSSGTELLNLINEILDLSKVEAGKIELVLEETPINRIKKDLQQMYQEVSRDKGVEFEVDVRDDCPPTITTDNQRLQQILRNLITNAIKFTPEGTVTLQISRPTTEQVTGTSLEVDTSLAFAVIDEGIGIPAHKTAAIFEAFQQVDGSTSRKYGGTGLGLSISKELSRLLGGIILLESVEGEGSTFTVVIPNQQMDPNQSTNQMVTSVPLHATAPDSPKSAGPADSQAPAGTAQAGSDPESVEVIDDRKDINNQTKSLLIIEDDHKFATVLRDFGRERGFKCIIADDGEKGLHFADFYRPSAIILDIGLPGIDGWTVMERLKDNPELRHIPVHFMSASDSSMDAMRMGAIGFLTKPVSISKIEETLKKLEQTIERPISRLLLVEDDELQRKSIEELIGNGDVKTTSVATGKDAFEELQQDQYDCIILDLGLGDMSGFELLEKIKTTDSISHIPVIVYTGRELSEDEETKLNSYAESIIIKGAKSPERLLDESALFLHRVEANLPDDKRQMLKMVHNKEAVLSDRTILLVDDDMRNVFALRSVLEEKNMNILIARDGIECLEKLEENDKIDAILMDIMMPRMDGYEAMTEIRKKKEYEKLPIIALTAKAMKGDRAKCIDAGASDYLAKPVNTDKLLSMLRVWLY